MGFRVVTARSSIDALGMTIRSKPDLVIISATMEGLSGVDLRRAMSTMSATAEIPAMILTSFKNGHRALSGAPYNVKIIHYRRSVRPGNHLRAGKIQSGLKLL